MTRACKPDVAACQDDGQGDRRITANYDLPVDVYDALDAAQAAIDNA